MVDNLRWARPGARLDESHLSDTGTVRSDVRVYHDLGGSSVFEEKITPQVSLRGFVVRTAPRRRQRQPGRWSPPRPLDGLCGPQILSWNR